MFAIAIILTTVILIFRLWNMAEQREAVSNGGKSLTNGGDGTYVHLWNDFWRQFFTQYGLPFGQICISFLYSVYLRFTLFNVTVFVVKYVPTGMYMFKFLRNIYVASRERLKEKQIELEDIQLQIQIVNTKLCVRDSEFIERTEQLRRDAERLRRLRARVRNFIAADEALQRALDGSGLWNPDHDLNVHTTPDQDREFIVELLKDLKFEEVGEARAERPAEKMECGEHAASEPHTPEPSIYSSLSDIDIKQDCRVKIVKVTNVYKVAYLKHFIKQKRLRRAHKHALLKKKMENIKKLLEDWHKTLNMVINNKLTILNMDSHIDVASQEAMGDYSKPLRESDSDSDLRNSSTDVSYDEYSLSWTQNPYRNYCYSFEDMPETVIGREYGEPRDFTEVKYPLNVLHPCDYHDPRVHKLSILPEETTSQVAIEEIKSAPDDFARHDRGVAVA